MSIYTGLSQKKQNILKNCTYKNTKKYQLNRIDAWGKCVKVYDGDTIHIALFINNICKKISCRLIGIDTYELRSKDKKEKELAIKAKERLKNLIYNKIIWVKILIPDKFGRYLIIIYKKISNDWEESYNNQLLKEKLAIKY